MARIDEVTTTYTRYRAGSMALADGDPVSTATDSGPNGFDATQATAASQPTFKTNIINGKPVFRFDGSDDFLSSAAPGSPAATTMFAVVRVNSLTGDHDFRGGDGSGALIFRVRDGKIAMSIQSTVGVIEAGSVSTTEFAILTADFTSGTSYAVHKDGTTLVSGATTAATANGRSTHVGRSSGSAGSLNGDLPDLILFDGVLSAEDRAKVHSDLSDEYGITVADYVAPSSISGTGTVQSTSSVTGDAAAGHTGSGSVSSASAVGAAGAATHAGDGAVASTSSTAGSAASTHDGAGSVESTSDGSGAAASVRSQSGEVVSRSDGTGTGTSSHAGSGSVTSRSTVTASGKRLLGGAVESTSTVSGAGVGGHTAGGSTTSTSSGTAVPQGGHESTGAVASRSSGVGDSSTVRSGGGSVTSTSSGVGVGYARQFASAGIVRPIVGLAIRLFDANGDVGEYAPSWSSIAFTDIYNESGTVAVDYAKRGINAALLFADRAEGALFDGALEIPGTRFLVTQQAQDAVKEDASGNTVTLNCPAWVPTRLNEARLYPPNWPDTEQVKHQFSNATPGAILADLLAEAKARGALGDVDFSFTSTATSDGQPWDRVVTIDIESGGSVYSVLETLVAMDVCDWRGNGRELVLLNPGSGVDRTIGDSPTVLRAGRDFLDAPEKRDLSDLATVVLVKGDDGVYVEVEDTEAVALYGRIETHVSASGVKDTGTLTVIGEATLKRLRIPRSENTHELSLFAEGGPQPWTDYFSGDYLLRGFGDGESPQRLIVRQLSATYAEDGTVTADVTLGDRLQELDERLKAQIDALTNGSAGSSKPADDPPADDVIAPEVPAGLQVTSKAYEAGQGSTFAAVRATWNAVTADGDGSTITDLGDYEVQWRVDGDTEWEDAGATRDTTLRWSPLDADLLIEVRVRALDTNGNESDWSLPVGHRTAKDAGAPPTPSTPTLTARLGQLKLVYDGLSDVGLSMPADTKYVRVHRSTTAGFERSADNLVDNLPPGGGVSILTDLVADQTYFVQLVAVDHTGNESGPSVEVSAVPGQIVNIDLGDDAIDRRNIRAAAIGSAEIDNLAVNEAHIATVNAGSIVSGIVDADVIVGGRFATSLTAVDRVIFDSTGIDMFQNDTLMVSIKPGSLLFTGEIRSGRSGDYWVGREDGTFQFFNSSNPTNPAEIMPVSDGWQWRTGADSNGRRGYLTLTPGVAFIHQATSTGTTTSRMICSHTYAVSHAPVIGMRVNEGLTPTDNTPHRVFFVHSTNGEVSGDIGSSVVYYRMNSGNTPDITGVVRNSGIQFGSSQVNVINEARAFGPIKASDFILSSSRDVKTDIRDLVIADAEASSVFERIMPKWFKRVSDDSQRDHLGFIAEEIQATYPGLVVADSDDGGLGVDIPAMLAIVWKKIQQLDAKVG